MWTGNGASKSKELLAELTAVAIKFPITRLIQAGSVLGEHSCNSVKVEYSLRGISHRFEV